MKIEQDQVEVLSGLRFGTTLGSPLTLAIHNKDWVNWQDRMSPGGLPQGEKVTSPRPGHADLTGVMKYQHQDIRNILERASARETAIRVAVGSVAKQLLALTGMTVVSHVVNIGGVAICPDHSLSGQEIGNLAIQSDLGCIQPAVAQQMKDAIQQAKDQGDTLGGIFEVVVAGALPGLGTHVHWDRRLDTRLGGALMSIPAIKGVEIGQGFGYAQLPGSLAHDEIFYDPDQGYYRQTNQAGGIEGGMSNGQQIIARGVMKAIPTLMKPLASVDIATKEATRANTERSDVCAVTAAAVVGEAMTAIVLAECLLEKFAGDSVGDFLAAVNSYRLRLADK
jgi:chorismate synthase